jgi:hypothetical protein
MSKNKKSNCETGFGKPPKQTSFVPGQSRHPSGRPKGTANLKSDLNEEIFEQVRITKGGRRLSVSKQRAKFKALVVKALNGDTRAEAMVFALVAKYVEPDLAIDLSKDIKPDDEIVADFVRRHTSDASGISHTKTKSKGDGYA